jgi:hypothetical protein
MPNIDLTRNPRDIPNFLQRKLDDAVSRYNMMRDSTRGWHTLVKDYTLESCGLLSPRSFHSAEVTRIIKQRIGEPYLMGIELECEGLDQDDRNRDRVSDLLQRYLPERHLCVTDGSLRQGGIEIVTTPLAPTEISRIQWYRLLKGLRKAGLWSFADASGESRCGLHVSISRNYLIAESWIKLRRFLTRYQAYFKAISQRSDTYYCAFTNETTKYTALNLSKQSVAEFRFFRGNLSPKRHIAAIETIRCLVETMRQCEDNGQNITPAQYRRSLDRFPMAKRLHEEYSAIWETATARGAGGTGVRRPRRSDAQIAVDLAHTFSRSVNSNLYFPRHVAVELREGIITVRARETFYPEIYGTPKRCVNPDMVPASFQWRFRDIAFYNMPERFQRDLQRVIGAGVDPLFIIPNTWGVSTAPLVEVYYRRGTFGRTSYARVVIKFN